VEHVRSTMLLLTFEVTKDKKTIFLLRSVTLQPIHVSAILVATTFLLLAQVALLEKHLGASGSPLMANLSYFKELIYFITLINLVRYLGASRKFSETDQNQLRKNSQKSTAIGDVELINYNRYYCCKL